MFVKFLRGPRAQVVCLIMAGCHSRLFVYRGRVKLSTQTFEKLESQHTGELSHMLLKDLEVSIFHTINCLFYKTYEQGLFNQSTLDISCTIECWTKKGLIQQPLLSALYLIHLLCAGKNTTIISIQVQSFSRSTYSAVFAIIK